VLELDKCTVLLGLGTMTL